ncbi:NAD(P)/FAD-dependent oxidoreductase [Planotetraspora sp. GP83]|uniref:NAD(P)/FAD-dependent oxidoreductase n=1 Tax=Planotetraspora sp. GP83 TaxID=3156264 RepID=UPI0035153C04
MTVTQDVVVIGGGLNGAATAYHLSRLGAGQVILLTGTMADRSASQDAVGLLRTHHDNRPEAALAAASMPFFEHWEEHVGAPNGWLPSGFIRFVGEDEVESLKTNVAIQHELGVEALVLGPAEIAGLHPYFDLHGIGAAVYEPNAGTADNWQCTTTLRAAVKRLGVHVSPTDATAILVDDRGVTGVETAGGETIATRTVVLAAGAWSKPLAASAGIALPLESRAISVGEIDLPEELGRVSSYMDPITDSWLTPRPGRRGLITLHDEFTAKPADPDRYGLRVDPAADAEGIAKVASRVPTLGGSKVRRSWTRVDTYAPDGKPIFGGVDQMPGLYLNVAAAGKGHKVAPAAGLSLSELILGHDTTTVDLTPFNLNRFAGAGFPVSGAEYAKRTIG